MEDVRRLQCRTVEQNMPDPSPMRFIQCKELGPRDHIRPEMIALNRHEQTPTRLLPYREFTNLSHGQAFIQLERFRNYAEFRYGIQCKLWCNEYTFPIRSPSTPDNEFKLLPKFAQTPSIMWIALCQGSQTPVYDEVTEDSWENQRRALQASQGHGTLLVFWQHASSPPLLIDPTSLSSRPPESAVDNRRQDVGQSALNTRFAVRSRRFCVTPQPETDTKPKKLKESVIDTWTKADLLSSIEGCPRHTPTKLSNTELLGRGTSRKSGKHEHGMNETNQITNVSGSHVVNAGSQQRANAQNQHIVSRNYQQIGGGEHEHSSVADAGNPQVSQSVYNRSAQLVRSRTDILGSIYGPRTPHASHHVA